MDSHWEPADEYSSTRTSAERKRSARLSTEMRPAPRARPSRNLYPVAFSELAVRKQRGRPFQRTFFNRFPVVSVRTRTQLHLQGGQRPAKLGAGPEATGFLGRAVAPGQTLPAQPAIRRGLPGRRGGRAPVARPAIGCMANFQKLLFNSREWAIGARQLQRRVPSSVPNLKRRRRAMLDQPAHEVQPADGGGKMQRR
eukprot:4462870-Prymnesium_polylepis.1